jgi:ABC-type Fe3+ transport system permease subunit
MASVEFESEKLKFTCVVKTKFDMMYSTTKQGFTAVLAPCFVIIMLPVLATILSHFCNDFEFSLTFTAANREKNFYTYMKV